MNDKWDSILVNASKDELKRYIPQVAEMARPVHPSSGFYTWLLGQLAIRTQDEV